MGGIWLLWNDNPNLVPTSIDRLLNPTPSTQNEALIRAILDILLRIGTVRFSWWWGAFLS
jgi:hypothetical protein